MTFQDVLAQSASELRQKAEAHQDLLSRAIEGRDPHSGADACALLGCPHRRRMKESLGEAIQVLEETRKAFKSKQLEKLRKKLIGVLSEDA